MASTQQNDLREFHDALAAVMQRVLTLLAEAAADPGHVAYRSLQRVDWASEQAAVTLETNLDWDLLMLIETRSLGESDAAMRRLTNATRSSPAAHRLLEAWNGEVGNPQDPARWLQGVLLAPFVRHYLARFSSIGYVDADFEAIFEHVTDALASTDVQVEIVSPLQSFRADTAGDFELSEGVRIVVLTDSQRQEIWQSLGQPPFGRAAVDAFELRTWTHAIRERIVCSRGDQPPALDGERTRKAISMLRLQKEGRVKPAIWWIEPVRPQDAYGGQAVWLGQRGLEVADPSPGESHTMSVDDLGEVAELLLQYEQRSDDPVFDFALRRFDLAHERFADADRLVDHWIALEALFGRTQKGQGRGDLTYRLTTRIPRFLREAQADRVALQQELRRLYNARSDVVHGTPLDPAKIAAAARGTEGHIRDALKRWLAGPSSPTLEDLDFGPESPSETPGPVA